MASTALAETFLATHASNSVAPPLPDCKTQRFLVAGEPIRRSDGTLDEGIEAQMQSAWLKLFSAMQAAGFQKQDLRNSTMYLTVGGQLSLFRRVRDRMLQHLAVPTSCLHVEGLESDGRCVEIEGVAVKF